jgi:hypothetical protein
MRRFLSNLASNFRSTNAARSTRRDARRPALQVEGLEDRMVLSTATQVGSALLVTADPGLFGVNLPGHPIVAHIRSISFQTDQANHAKVDVLDSGAVLGKFTIASLKSVNVNVAGLDAVSVDDTVGLPFASGTTVSLFGGGILNSLSLTGSRVVSGGETYAAGNGAQAGSLALGGVTFQFGGTIGSVTDLVKTTAPLVVKSSGGNVALNGQDGVTQQLTGLAGNGGGGDTLTYSNKGLVNLELFGNGAGATLNATKGATGETSFVIDLFGTDEDLFINATPSNVTTSAVVGGPGADVDLRANAGRVSVAGVSSTLLTVGQVVPNVGFSTAGIKADVSVNGVGHLTVQDGGNHSTQEHVTVTESMISGTGLFGTGAVKLTYGNTAILEIVTGHLANTYSVIGSRAGAFFGSKITIDDGSDVGMSVFAGLDSGSHLNLSLLNTFAAHPAPASLFLSAPHGTFSHPTPNIPAGIEDVTFAGGFSSEVVYNGFTSVTHS